MQRLAPFIELVANAYDHALVAIESSSTQLLMFCGIKPQIYELRSAVRISQPQHPNILIAEWTVSIVKNLNGHRLKIQRLRDNLDKKKPPEGGSLHA